MKFNVVIPLFNKQKTVRRAIFSVLNQTDINPNDIEIIVVDDGSTDQSAAVVRNIQTQVFATTIRLIEQTNKGVSAARNKGVAASTSEFVCFLDADDALKPRFLSLIRVLIEKHRHCGLFATAYDFVDDKTGVSRPANVYGVSDQTQVLTDFFHTAAYGDLPFCASSVCIRRTVFNQIGGFPVGDNMGEDQLLYCKAAISTSIAYSPQSAARYFTDVAGSLMQTEQVAREMPFSQYLQRRLDSNDIPQHLIKSVQLYISGHLTDLIRRNVASGNLRAAKKIAQDSRSKTRVIKWLYWRLKIMAAA